MNAATGPGGELACDACLRHGHLVGHLAPRIAGVLDGRGRRPRGVLALDEDELIRAIAGGGAGAAHAFLDQFGVAEARAALEREGVTAVCRHARSYPTRLLQLADPPRVLFAKARAAEPMRVLARGPQVAVVGARQASVHGLEIARSLGRGLAAAGVTVVSGLALGVDAAAHQGCLAGAGMPVAVVGGGPDVPYPRTNAALHGRIVDGGVVVSELPPGVRPYRWSFPARNRIMAGLSEMTVVVEAAERSGSLITTDFAADLGRVVAAVPGEVTSRRARGSNELLRAGAAVVLGVEDILEELYGSAGAGTNAPEADTPAGDVPSPRPEGLAGDRASEAVLEAVGCGEGVDGASRHAGLSVPEVRAILSRLEADGLLRRDALGSYTRVLA